MTTTPEPKMRALMSPNGSTRYIKVLSISNAASGGGGSSNASGSGGNGGDGGSGFAEHESVSSLVRRNHDGTTGGTTQGLSDSSYLSSFVAHAPMHPQTSIANFDRAYDPDNLDPLSYFLASWRNDHDPFDFGVGSVADGTFGGREPTCEQLLLFRSHRLMQAEAVSVAMGKAYSTSAFERQRFGLIGSTVAHKVWVKLLEKTNSTLERIGALVRDGIPHNKQEEVINEERKICNRMIADILDRATRALKEMSNSVCSISSGSGCSEGSEYGNTSGFGNTSGNNYYSAAAMEPGLGSESDNRQAFSPSTLESSPPSESHQLATNSAWEGATNTSCVAMAPLPSIAPPIIPPGPQQQLIMPQQQPIIPQQQPIMPSPGCMVGRSSVFALTKMRDHLYHHAPLGFPGGLSNAMSHGVDERQSAARTYRLTGQIQGKQTNKKSLLVTKTGAKMPVGLQSAHSNRKGSRHRLTPQAKEVLEGWLAKHWLNPYPTEEEKLFLSQACKITVTQVNNWMMNVRVRRCRTKKIGVATGPGQLTFANVPKAVAANTANVPKGTAAAEAEHLLADQIAFTGTKEVTSTTIVGGSNGKPPEKSRASPRAGK